MDEKENRLNDMSLHLNSVFKGIRKKLPGKKKDPWFNEFIDEMEAAIKNAAILGISPKEEAIGRVEANALVAYCFRNQLPFEEFHASGKSLDDSIMKRIMIDACRRTDAWLRTREIMIEECPQLWEIFVATYHEIYCSQWEK